MRTGLTKREKTTAIYFDEYGSMIEVQTHNTDLKKRLTAFAAKYPQCCRQIDDDEQGGLTFEVEKSLIADLRKHENTSEYFYAMRDLDRDKEAYQAMSKVERASRLIYLNKTCFNGLFRVNSSGEFNSPFGHYKNPNIVNEPVLRAVSKYFSSGNITFCNEDFAVTLSRVGKGGFVYLDPPYDPVSDTASFTGYNKGGFDRNEQIRLKQCCDELTQRGIKFMLSNSATEFIKELYTDYNILHCRML